MSKRILVVDDHGIVRDGIRLILSADDELEVAGEAGSGSEALARLRAEPFDAVLLDIHMPDRSGIDVLGEIKEQWPDLPVLMLSMYPEEQYAIRALRFGASGYLTKDSASDELLTALRSVLAGNRFVTASLAQLLADEVLGEGQRPAHERLSPREYQVLIGLARGRSIKEIGAELFLSPKTISTYRSRVLEKLALSSNAELTRYAVENSLID